MTNYAQDARDFYALAKERMEGRVDDVMFLCTLAQTAAALAQLPEDGAPSAVASKDPIVVVPSRHNRIIDGDGDLWARLGVSDAWELRTGPNASRAPRSIDHIVEYYQIHHSFTV